MGSEQSSSSQRNEKERYSREDVERMLQEQKRRLEQERSKQQQPQQQNQCLERNRTPYSFSQNDIHIGVAQETKTNLYPNLNTNVPSSSSGGTSSNVYYSSNASGGTSKVNYNLNKVPENINVVHDYHMGHQRPLTPTAPLAQQPVPRQVQMGSQRPLTPAAPLAQATSPRPVQMESQSSNASGGTSQVNYNLNKVPENINVVHDYHMGHQRPLTPTAPLAQQPVPRQVQMGSQRPLTPAAPLAQATSPRPVQMESQRPLTPTAPPAQAPRPVQRDRSASRPRNKARHRDEDELNCSTCNQKYTLTIYQCDAGHSSCSHCRNVRMCGVCGRPIGDVRNRSLEDYIAERKIKCPNFQDGCRLYIKMADLENHEKECPFREMRCPLAAIFGQCQWIGKLPQISKHFEEVHPIHCNANVGKEMTTTGREKQIVYYVAMGNFNFLFNLNICERKRKVFMTVQLIGTKHSAHKWSYEIHVYNKNEPRRKYQYIDICQSNNTPLKEIFDSEQCAVLPLSYANTFINRDLFTFKFYIRKDIESKTVWNRGGNNHRQM